MLASELRKLINKKVIFKSNRTWEEFRYGVIEEVVRRETCISGDWHDNKSIKIKGRE